jgi:ubiquitin carboxyl-terminal hydrolase L3
LEDSHELEAIYKSIALENPSAEHINPEEEVDYHYIAFVRGSNGALFEMDGDTDKGPRSLGSSGSKSLSSNATIQETLKQYLERGGLNELGFSLLVLVGEI